MPALSFGFKQARVFDGDGSLVDKDFQRAQRVGGWALAILRRIQPDGAGDAAIAQFDGNEQGIVRMPGVGLIGNRQVGIVDRAGDFLLPIERALRDKIGAAQA